MPSKFAFQFNSLTRLIRAEKEVKIASPEESGRIVTHENVPFSSSGNYERRGSKLADKNAKCPRCILKNPQLFTAFTCLQQDCSN